MTKFYISVNNKSRIIKSYFEELTPPYSVEYIEEDEPLGTAGAWPLSRAVSMVRSS